MSELIKSGMILSGVLMLVLSAVLLLLSMI